MAKIYTDDELNSLDREDLIKVILTMQGDVSKLSENIEYLMEQIRLANAERFGRKTEKLSQIDGQLSFFDEVENTATDTPEDNSENEKEIVSKVSKCKQKGKRAADYKDFRHEPHPHTLSDNELDAFFGAGCWRRMKSEKCMRLRFQPGEWIVEDHSIDVAVGTDGDHQDEFMRAKRPKDLLRNSIVTPSLEAAIINAKYTNALPLDRIEKNFMAEGVPISKQTMSNWTLVCAERYLSPLWDRLKEELLKSPVTQCDETFLNVLHQEGEEDRTNTYMWMHRSGEFDSKQMVLCEYQSSRHHKHPLEFYKDYKGILVSDSLQQYHMLERLLPGVTSANCWAHARRSFAEAIKAADKANRSAIQTSIAYQALKRIGTFYELDTALKSLSSEERYKERQKSIKPLVEEYFAWVKQVLADRTVPPKSLTAKGLNFSVNQEKYLKVFLDHGDVPIDNSATERSIRPFTIGRKNWLFMNTERGARDSAIIYSITETAKLNNLNVYRYVEHLLTELPKLRDDDGNIDTAKLDALLPWADEVSAVCRKGRR